MLLRYGPVLITHGFFSLLLAMRLKLIRPSKCDVGATFAVVLFAFGAVRAYCFRSLCSHEADFLTLIVPLAAAVRDLQNVATFLHHRFVQKEEAVDWRLFHFLRKKRKELVPPMVVFTTFLGIIALMSVMGSGDCASEAFEFSPGALPDGFQCLDKQFNLFLDGGCACSYVYARVPECGDGQEGDALG